MEITGPPPSSPSLTANPPGLQSWQVGQILRAVVVAPTVNQVTTLQIGNERIQASTPRPVDVGHHLKVEVVQNTPQPLLKVLNATQPNNNIENSLRQALPRQAPLTSLLANITLIATRPAQLPLPLAIPPQLSTAIRQLFERLPDRKTVTTSSGLKQAVQDSGLFLERKLGDQIQHATPRQNRTQSIQTDLKAHLLRILLTAATATSEKSSATTDRTGTPPLPSLLPLTTASNTTLPPPLRGTTPKPQSQAEATLMQIHNLAQALQEIRQQSEGALARLQLHQIASLPAVEQGVTHWSFELPVRNGDQVDLFHLQIETEEESQHRDTKQNKKWSITIAFDIDKLGPIHARLRLYNDQISATLWVEQASTTHLVRQHLEQLQNQFDRAGLEVTALNCQSGCPPISESASNHHAIVDINA